VSPWRIVRKSLIYYWGTSLGILLSVAVGTAILTGALAVGDSVEHSLGLIVDYRLGRVEFAMAGHDKLVTEHFAQKLSAELGKPTTAVLQLRGMVSNSEGTKRANRVEVLGVDEKFFALGLHGKEPANTRRDGIIVNEALANKLAIRTGDEVILRMSKPAVMSREAPLALDSDLTTAWRVKVKSVIGDLEFGRFSLVANQLPPLNVFLPLEVLQEKTGQTGYANTVLVGRSTGDRLENGKVNKVANDILTVSDIGLELRELEPQDVIELRSREVFINDTVVEAAVKAGKEPIGILAYFVNEVRLGKRVTPYSMIAAMGCSEEENSIVPADMRDDEIIISQWLADDLDAKVGDEIKLSYFVLGPMRRLDTRESSFHVRAILPMDDPAIDADLMPDFPGIAEADNCRDWEPGVPIDLEKIRDKDEQYWNTYRGAPKAFVTLKAGQSIWGNRFGNLTAIRWPAENQSKEEIASALLAEIDAASLGVYFDNVKSRGVKAGKEGTDFGMLFLGLSMFLIIAALVLMALVFVFGVEKRSEQSGTLLAIGYTQASIQRLLLAEGGILAVVGAIVGAAGGIVYTLVMIVGLHTVWRGAIAGTTIHFGVQPGTILIGGVSGVAMSVAAIFLSLRRHLKRPARELLTGEVRWGLKAGKGKRRYYGGLIIGGLAGLCAVAIIVLAKKVESTALAAVFFSAGALLLVGELGFAHSLMKFVSSRLTRPVRSIRGLGLRSCARRIGRSLAVVGLLAAGSFMVISVSANAKGPLADAWERNSGTGGFALFAESTVGILKDLNSSEGRATVGLDDENLQDISFVPFRVRQGDDASCFNLNRAQKPQLLGVEAMLLKTRSAFSFVEVLEQSDERTGWSLLDSKLTDGSVPGIADYPTIVWALGKSVGDVIKYTDEQGRSFQVRLVAMLSSSVLQGNVIISEQEFIRRFPSEQGYRIFLIDAERQQTEKVGEMLTKGLRDFGFESTPAIERLAAFNTVENTYLSIFQLLGGLGLVLGSIGLGLVVLLNTIERRGELAMLRAVGYTKAKLKEMILFEYGGLLLFGLLFGVIASLIAVGPLATSPGAEVPYFSLAVMVVVIAGSGIGWIWAATVFALRGSLLDAIRNE